MHSSTEALRSDVDMDNDALRFACQSGVAIGHGERDHLDISAWCDMEEKAAHTSLGHVMILGNWPFFSFCPLTMASMILG